MTHSPFPRARRPARAFTLVEIVVVIGIIILLLVLLIPAVLRVKESGRTTGCLAHLRQLGAGLNAYLADHDLTMPNLQAGRNSLNEAVPTIDTELAKYVTDKQTFACPADSKLFAQTGTSYFWNNTLNGQKLGSLDFMKITEKHAQIPVLSDKEGFHPFIQDRVNILYADGHASQELQFRTSE